MSEVTISINDDGSVHFLDTNAATCFKTLGSAVLKRASHVEPNQLLLRAVFHTLRYMFGDKGWMATFTRYWPCAWRVNVSPLNGPILPGTWRDRQQAIDAEVTWLNCHIDSLVQG